MPGVVTEAELKNALEMAECLAATFHRQWRCLELEDLEQEARIAVVYARDGFRRGVGASFITYSHRAIERRLERFKEKARQARRAGVQVLSYDSLPAPHELPEHGSEEPGTNRVEARLFLAPLLSRLEDDELRLLDLRYWRNQSIRAAGRELGVTGQCVANRERRVLTKLREAAG